ncbi:MAG: GNVR domain-containing protein [Longimicrobiaceae bacterium]
MNHSSPDPARDGARPRAALLAMRVARDWKIVLATTVAAVLTAGVAAALTPPTYTARTVLFLAQSQSDPRAQALAAQLPMSLPGLGGGSNQNAKLVGVVLESRTLADTISARVGKAARRHHQNNPDGSIVIDVTDGDPRQAARVANAYEAAINDMISRISLQSTRLKQQFLRGQLAQARERMDAAERKMVAFQRTRGAGNVEEQTTRTVEAVVELQRGITEQEIVVGQLRRTSTPDNPELRAAVAELNARREQLRRLSSGGGGSRVFVPLGQSADLQASTLRLLREFTEAEQIYRYLAGSFAEAQISGSNNLPVVNVLDPALVPQAPSGTSTPVILAVAALAGLVLGLLIALVRALVHYARLRPETAELLVAWNELKAERSRKPARRSTGVA